MARGCDGGFLRLIISGWMRIAWEDRQARALVDAEARHAEAVAQLEGCLGDQCTLLSKANAALARSEGLLKSSDKI